LRQGQQPEVSPILADTAQLSLEQLATLLAVDQWERWRRGERVPAEAYLQQYPALQTDLERALELVYGEFLLREECGEAPALEEYLQRFPQYAARLEEQVALHRATLEVLSPSSGGQLSGLSAGPTRPGGKDCPALDTLPDRHRDNFLAPPQGPGELGRLGRYRLLKVQGTGGMAVVFQAEDTLLRRLVALKVLRPALAVSVVTRLRFLREARAVAAIDHDHIIAIYDLGQERGIPFLAMPLLKGESLDDRLRRQPCLPLAEAVRIGREVAEGLAAAHERGLIHRDIKPGNIWLEVPSPQPLSPSEGERGWGEGGRVKILDFGLVRAAGEPAHLTRTGDILGTPAYLAPEQALGSRVDHRCDLFSLGCVLYQASSGKLPFQGSSAVSLLAAVITQTPHLLQELNPEVPPALSSLVMQLLAKECEQRPASAAEVVKRLQVIEGELT
jgi:hypothetical protein